MKKTIYILLAILLLCGVYKYLKSQEKIKDYFSNTFIKEKLTFYIVSINDKSYNINIEGNIENTIDVKIPYKIDNSKKIDLEAYEQTILLNEENSKEKEKNAKLTFSYPKQIGLRGEGYINATLKIYDKESNIPDYRFKTRQLEIEKEDEYTLAEFLYPRNLKYKQYGILEIKIISGIKDRMFDSKEHSKRNQKYIYYPIMSPITGKYWLNNNLGSYYSNIINDYWKKNPFQQAKSITDKDAYGNLFQWGRKSDGHEIRGKFEYNGFTDLKSDNPKHKLHIVSSNYPYDWREKEDNSLWQENKENNNVCPIGWRVPTKKEFLDEFINSSVENNHLKLTLAGYRLNIDNSIFSENLYGNYWTSDIENSYANFLLINHQNIETGLIYKSAGFSVRCIKK